LLEIAAKFWQSAKIWQVFETGGRTYFMLLVDRFITYTNKIALVRPGPKDALSIWMNLGKHL